MRPGGTATYCGQDLAHLFTLRIRVGSPARMVVIDAWEGFSSGSHTRIDVQVRERGEVIFPRGQLYCGLTTIHAIDGPEARELVLSLVAMRPGDTDRDYFDGYTEDQLAWAEQMGEEINMIRESRYGEGS